MAELLAIPGGENPPEKPRTLGELLAILQAVDDALVDFDPADLKAIAAEVNAKIDGVKFVLDLLQSRALQMKTYSDEFTAKKRALENSAERLRALVIFAMKSNNFEKLPGAKFQVALNSSESVVISDAFATPDAALFMRFENCIKRSYAWDKNAIRTELKKGNSELQAVARVEKSEWLKFSARTR